MIVFLILHYKNEEDTINCINSILKNSNKDYLIFLLNNEESENKLENLYKNNEKIKYYKPSKNLGFAKGNNFLIQKSLYYENIEDIIFLNNDTIIEQEFINKVYKKINEKTAKYFYFQTNSYNNENKIDSIGIEFTTSGVAFNKINKKRKTFCPMGACMLYKKELIKELLEKHGYFFDEDYFCYAEDLDVGFRSLLLGYKPNFINVKVLHKGSASTSKMSDFAIYHSYRNIEWTIKKNYPKSFLIKYFLWIKIAKLGIILNSIYKKRYKIYKKAYKDAKKDKKKIKNKREIIQKSKKIKNKELLKFFTKTLYSRDYL
ncbi:glycosyltransferase family 2 protein [Patescibacteria group bacterium]|nr:glycosyltransferase family 2 protein [Patescibacteria group bacterium]